MDIPQFETVTGGLVYTTTMPTESAGLFDLVDSGFVTPEGEPIFVPVEDLEHRHECPS